MDLGRSPDLQFVIGETNRERTVGRRFGQDSAEVGLELRSSVAKQVRCGGRKRERLGYKVIRRPDNRATVGHDDEFRATEPSGAKHRRLVTGRGIPDALASSAVLTEIRTAELGDGLDRRSRESVT